MTRKPTRIVKAKPAPAQRALTQKVTSALAQLRRGEAQTDKIWIAALAFFGVDLFLFGFAAGLAIGGR